MQWSACHICSGKAPVMVTLEGETDPLLIAEKDIPADMSQQLPQLPHVACPRTFTFLASHGLTRSFFSESSRS